MTSSLHPAAKAESPDFFIFEGRTLRPGVKLTETARFEDDVWPLSPASLQGQERGLNLRFSRVPTPYRHTMKKVVHAMLRGPLPGEAMPPSISSIVTRFFDLTLFLTWLDADHPGSAIGEITESILRDYQRLLLSRHRSYTRRYALRAGVAILWRLRESLGPDGLGIDPRLVDGWSEEWPSQPNENTTPRIPEDVHSRVLVWALRFVRDFSDDILMAVNRWDSLRGRRDGEGEPSGPMNGRAYGSAEVRIREFLRTAYSESRPLPGSASTNGKVSMFAIARLLRCDRRALEPYYDEIRAAADDLGVSEFVYLGVSMRATLDGQPWLEGVSLDPSRDDSLTVLTQMLQAACYVVIAFLSGMRDNEVKHLRAGCCTAERDSVGIAYRWKVESLAFKGESSQTGVPASWIVGAPAAQAIDVLERIHRERANGRTDWLFAPIKTGPGAGSAGRGGNQAMTVAGTNRQLNRFVTWVNDYCATMGRSDGIPGVDGKPWRLSTRQFRRTLAWYIARRPGGSIAGAIAYRHHSVQMFEGYAGTSESGFRAEVEAEEALARGEELLTMIEQNEHTGLMGPAASEAARRLQTMASEPSFAGTVTTDPRRFIRLMERHGPAVYPGQYVTCVYSRDRALCRTKTGAGEPDLSDCKPLICRNVALTVENVQTWRDELATIDAELDARPPLPPLMEQRLQLRRKQIVSFLHRSEEL